MFHKPTKKYQRPEVDCFDDDDDDASTGKI